MPCRSATIQSRYRTCSSVLFQPRVREGSVLSCIQHRCLPAYRQLSRQSGGPNIRTTVVKMKSYSSLCLLTLFVRDAIASLRQFNAKLCLRYNNLRLTDIRDCESYCILVRWKAVSSFSRLQTAAMVMLQMRRLRSLCIQY